jgi:hypothetical protein
MTFPSLMNLQIKSRGFSFYSDICEYIFMLRARPPFHLLSKLFWAVGHYIYLFGVNLQFSLFKPGSYVMLSVRLEWSVEAVRWGYATSRYRYNDICMCEHEPSQTIFSFFVGTRISIYFAKPPKSRDLICVIICVQLGVNFRFTHLI